MFFTAFYWELFTILKIMLRIILSFKMIIFYSFIKFYLDLELSYWPICSFILHTWSLKRLRPFWIQRFFTLALTKPFIFKIFFRPSWLLLSFDIATINHIYLAYVILVYNVYILILIDGFEPVIWIQLINFFWIVHRSFCFISYILWICVLYIESLT